MRTKQKTTQAVNVRAVSMFADCGKCGTSLLSSNGSLLVEVPDDDSPIICWKCGAENSLPASMLRVYRPKDTETPTR